MRHAAPARFWLNFPMTPISIIPCGEDDLRWLDRLPPGEVEPDANGWPDFTYPMERSGLKRGWQVAFLRVSGRLRAVVIARRGDRVGRVSSRFEVRAWKAFGAGIDIEELKNEGLTVANALSRDEQLTGPQERDLVAALARHLPWLPETIRQWRRQAHPPRIPENAIGQLSFERDCVRMPLGLSGQRPELVETYAYDESHRSYMQGLHGGVRPSEDSMIRHDWANLTGWTPPRDTFFDARTFTSPSGANQLTLIYANRERPEHATGADLIYIDETRNSVILVQYKRMDDKAADGSDGYRPDQQLEEELRRMRALRTQFAKEDRARGTDAFRLHTDPCFIKLCDPVVTLDLGTLPQPGMVLPLALFNEVHKEIENSGPRGGTRFTKKNIRRSLSSTELIEMVKDGWLGTCTLKDGYEILKDFCERELAAGKSITAAKARRRKPRRRPKKSGDPGGSFHQDRLI